MTTGTLTSTTLASDRTIESKVSRAGNTVIAALSNQHGDIATLTMDDKGSIEVMVTSPDRDAADLCSRVLAETGSAWRITLPVRKSPSTTE